ncbi:hypothetical protein ANCDUO_05570 [Ancylostoma duodenale]|uniref:Uncharacterized protein n=1 Tax=Ancylostoma duodenale TaxID=51022 RepID=A0A0C2GS34_9BILA|nr:hypothetical protein ANCDUO_05570 [Ancylostoma duodenale]
MAIGISGYWKEGFMTVQKSINNAIYQILTGKHVPDYNENLMCIAAKIYCYKVCRTAYALRAGPMKLRKPVPHIVSEPVYFFSDHPNDIHPGIPFRNQDVIQTAEEIVMEKESRLKSPMIICVN